MTDTPGGEQPPSEGQPPGDTAPGTPPAPQPPADQSGYWQQAQQPGQPQQPWQTAPQAPMQYAPDHPRAITALVLGILGIVLCQLVAPFAWVIGKRTVDEIDGSGGRMGGRGQAQAGYILGVIGSLILGASLLFGLVLLVIFVIGAATSAHY